jgi:hypothetical protein
VGGSFRLRIDHPGWGYRLVASGSNLRARLFGLPYGDQALFVRRTGFDAVGGYPEDPLMEDVVLVRRLRQRGKLVAIAETVTTGTRHWQHLGPLLTTLLNWATVSLYVLGVSPAKLAPWYHRLRKRGQALEDQCSSQSASAQGFRLRQGYGGQDGGPAEASQQITDSEGGQTSRPGCAGQSSATNRSS